MPKILLIEDEEILRESIAEMLSLEQFQVEAVADGKAGIALAQQQPDLILCDVMLPELDGFGVLTVLRQCAETATIPFIFLTAKSDRANLRQGMSLGADDYLVKPFSPQELLQSIATQFAKRSAIDRTMQQQLDEQLDELRRNIALSLPHELHTPLAGIIGMSDLLHSECLHLDPIEVQTMLDTIRLSALRLHRLTQNFLLYAELELTATQGDRGADALRDDALLTEADCVLADAAAQVAQRFDRLRDLQLDLAPVLSAIPHQRLHKLVEELVDNACKFSPPQTAIAIACRAQPFELTVQDAGRGMTSEQIARIGGWMQFDRKLHEQQGSGLGLAIVRRLAQRYGGNLAIDSAPGAGTIVRVRFD